MCIVSNDSDSSSSSSSSSSTVSALFLNTFLSTRPHQQSILVNSTILVYLGYGGDATSLGAVECSTTAFLSPLVIYDSIILVCCDMIVVE